VALAAGAVLGVVALASIAFGWQRLDLNPVWLAAGALLLLIILLWATHRMTRWALRPLAGASTVIEALRDGDYSLRLREARLGGLDELADSINLLADSMRAEALGRRESGLLLGKILDEIELPVLAFRDDGLLTLSNPAARALIGLKLHDGIDAESLAMGELLDADIADSVRLVLPGGSGRFVVRRRRFRLGGVPHQLLVLAEVGGVLSAERNEAWQGLVRVMSHEINNSLSPIKSMAETWRSRIGRDPGSVDLDRLGESLELIARRSGSLSRFVGLYASLARLPDPDPRPIRIDHLIDKLAALETRVQIRAFGPAAQISVDADQLEQALINLLRNAAEASLERTAEEPGVEVNWRIQGKAVEIDVLDTGPGPPPSENLFVPFFTTKSGGSGIGLLLVRRIAELHGGEFDLLPRSDGRIGACARLRLLSQ
jgi:nitrogen fixation/metabolism regulation signal transduction histidine kinase